jgi:serine/threonine-protein kinase
MIQLQLLGGLAVTHPVIDAAGLRSRRRSLALLALVAASEKRPLAREKALALLWPESDTARGRNSLRQTMFTLRRELDDDIFAPDSGDGIQLDPNRVRVDLWDFRDALKRNAHVEAVNAYGGGFLDGFHVPGLPSFSQWVEDERQRLEQQHASALEALASFAEQHGKFEEAVQWRRRQADADPLSSRATLTLLRAMLATGDRVGAMKHAAQHERLIRRELEIDPDPAITELVAAIRREGTPTATRAVAATVNEAPPSSPVFAALPTPPAQPSVAPPRRSKMTRIGAVLGVVMTIAALWAFMSWREPGTIDSVVVMPFRAVASGNEQPYLESGIADAIATRLASVTSLRVPPLAAIRRDEGPFEAGRRLGTEAVLTGTIQRAGDRLQVTAQLTAVRRGTRLWSVSFDAAPGEILGVQNEIAERIAVRLRTAMSAADRERLRARDTPSGEAYDLFLQAHEKWERRTPEMVQQAITLYEKAIAIDPQFVRAYAGLADCYNLAMSGMPPAYRYPRAKEYAEKAVALDSTSAEARTSLAFMRYKFEWRWADADREFREAIRLNPRYALAHHWYAEYLALMRREPEAVAEFQRALELDPFSLAIRADFSHPLIRLKRTAEARRLLNEGLQIDPNWSSFPMSMAEILESEGRDRESAEQTWRAMTLRGIPTAEIEELRTAFEKGGLREMIRAQIRQRLRQEVKPTSSASFLLATYLSFDYGRLGEREQALHWLNVAIDRREDAVIHMLTNPAYDSLRGDPRFQALLKRLDLVQFATPR